jgi:hypothetical protein
MTLARGGVVEFMKLGLTLKLEICCESQLREVKELCDEFAWRFGNVMAMNAVMMAEIKVA